MEQPRSRSIIFLVLSGALLVPAILLVLAHVAGPNDAARIDLVRPSWEDSGVTVIAREKEGSSHQRDVVLAADGIPIEELVGNLAHPERWLPLDELESPMTYTVLREGATVVEMGSRFDLPVNVLLTTAWDTTLLAGAMFALGLLVFGKKPREHAALAMLMLGAGSTFAYVAWATVQVPDLMAGWPFLLALWLWHVGTIMTYAGLVHFTLVFPQPLGRVTRNPWIVPAAYGVIGLCLLGSALLAAYRDRTVVAALAALDLAWLVLTPLALAIAVIVLAINWRRSTSPVARQQVRWVVFAFSVTIVVFLSVWLVPQLLGADILIDWHLAAPVSLLTPIAMAIAILRHNLFDIDLIISRTLLWVILTALVILAYAGIVTFIGLALEARGSIGPSLVATGVVAVLFQPVRERVQRLVNRVVYGERDEPYAIVSRLGHRLESAIVPGAVLPTITETVAQALKLPYVAISLGKPGEQSVATAYGAPAGDILTLPLVYQSDCIGELRLSARGQGETFSRADRRVIDDLARQVGVAAHAVRLTEELQQSRQRIVTAREEERRRLRRELHDGVGPSLASILLKLEAGRNRLHTDPGGVDRLLAELKVQAQDAIGDVRRVAYELRPPALDDLGLDGALREFAARGSAGGMRVGVSTNGDLDDLPAAVEVAAYRIAVEAITNAVRHSGGTTCAVTLVAGDLLEITVSDDGRGSRASTRPGVGTASMRERASEVGGRLDVENGSGGLTVTAILPLPANEDGQDLGG